MYRPLFYILTSCFLLLLFSCNQPTPPPQQTVQLAADYIGAKEVWLRLIPSQGRGARLMRDGSAIYTNESLQKETLVIDSNLVPSRSYTYTATPLKDGRDVDEPSRLQVTTLDMRSHAVSWVVDTLGVQGIIRDVWVFDQNNIWAVGEIQTDFTGEYLATYGAAIWNGSSWRLQRLEALGPTGFTSNLRPRGIYAFSRTDIWLASGGVFHWNGQSITPYWINSFPGNPNPILSEGQTAVKIWGTSSSNIYAVGRRGAIAHFNGTVWRKMESGTTVDLEDIWGIDEKHIWTTGRTDEDSRSVILQLDGSRWNTLYDNTTKPPQEKFDFNSVWTNVPNILFFTGPGPSGKFHVPTQLFRRDSGKQFFAYRIRGTSAVDMFVSGQGSEVLHYNGSSWYLYPEIKALEGDLSSWWFSISVQQRLVVIGGVTLTGLNFAPVVIRGYR